MFTKAVILLAALYTQEVLSSHYHGPIAIPHVLHNGYLADTHEVAAAKSDHLATKQSHGYDDDHSSSMRYHGPTAIPHVLHDGHIADTDEVATAKAEHFAAVAKEHAYGGAYSGSYAGGHHGHSHHVIPYHGPLAKPVVLHTGYLADTHEVTAAKAEHLTAVAKEHAHGGAYSGSYAGGHHGHSHHVVPYHGPLAKPVILHTRYLADTHEVAATKAEHLTAIAKEHAHGGAYSGSYAGGHHGHSHHVVPYHGPLAKPVILHTGYLADTHEVAAAKAEHLTAVAKEHAHGGAYSGSYAGGHHGHSLHVVPYHGPLAKPVILHTGYLADTHEVAAAKAEHLTAVAKEHAHGGAYSGSYAEGHHGHSHHVVPYHGPLAKPVVLHTGYLADTHEVAAAKQHHLQTLYSSHHGHYNYY